MKSKTLLFLTAVVFLLKTDLFAGDPGFQFLRVGVSARATGLADGFVSQNGDITTMLSNPAGLARINEKNLSASYLNHWMDISSGLAVYAQPVPELKGVVGFGIVYFNYGDFQGYDASGNATTTYSAGDLSLNLSYAHSFNKNIDAGVTVKWIRSTIENYKAKAYAVDFGGVHRFSEQKLTVGASLLNVGSSTQSFAGKKESLPTSLQVGATKTLEHAPVDVSLGFTDLNVSGNRFSRWIVGAEWTPIEPLTLRGGMNHQRRTDADAGSGSFLKTISGISAGFSFRYDALIFDYSFTSWGIGSLNRFSFTMTL